MRTVSFFRRRAISNGGLVWVKVAEYAVPALADDSATAQQAASRLEQELQVPSWQAVADAWLVREGWVASGG